MDFEILSAKQRADMEAISVSQVAATLPTTQMTLKLATCDLML